MHIKSLNEIRRSDVEIAGGKGASLGEMKRAGFQIPNGFVLLTKVYKDFRDNNKISEEIKSEILKNFKNLNSNFVAVRSSATVEDGREHTWAGQFDTFLNTTESTLIANIEKCFESLDSNRAELYKKVSGQKNREILVAVVVQEMIQSEISGVGFSVHPVLEDTKKVVIEAINGLGEALVGGKVTPDTYTINKDNFEILEVKIPKKELQKLSNVQIIQLAKLVCKVEAHYQFPCDVEWAFANNQFFILQSRPITTLKKQDKKHVTELYKTQISITEWFEKIGHKDSGKIKKEDNTKRDRLAVLNKIIRLPFDKPVRFEVEDIFNQTKEFKKYLNANKNKLCALRLMPKKPELPKLRMRGHTVSDVTKTWLKEQKINPNDYVGEYVPHSEKCNYSTIFVINKRGIFGEVTRGGHDELTQGFYTKHLPIRFEFNFSKNHWNYTGMENKHDKVKKRDIVVHIKKVVKKLYVGEARKRKLLEKDLKVKFENKYITGYFETVDSQEFGLWFIDYNRILPKYLSKINIFGDAKIFGKSLQKTVGKVIKVLPGEKVDGGSFKGDEILVCEMTTPEYIHIIQKVAGVVTEKGGILSHAAIICRELNKPCIAGVEDALQKFNTGDLVEIDLNLNQVRKCNKINL